MKVSEPLAGAVKRRVPAARSDADAAIRRWSLLMLALAAPTSAA